MNGTIGKIVGTALALGLLSVVMTGCVEPAEMGGDGTRCDFSRYNSGNVTNVYLVTNEATEESRSIEIRKDEDRYLTWGDGTYTVTPQIGSRNGESYRVRVTCSEGGSAWTFLDESGNPTSAVLEEQADGTVIELSSGPGGMNIVDSVVNIITQSNSPGATASTDGPATSGDDNEVTQEEDQNTSTGGSSGGSQAGGGSGGGGGGSGGGQTPPPSSDFDDTISEIEIVIEDGNIQAGNRLGTVVAISGDDELSDALGDDGKVINITFDVYQGSQTQPITTAYGTPRPGGGFYADTSFPIFFGQVGAGKSRLVVTLYVQKTGESSPRPAIVKILDDLSDADFPL